MCNDIVIIGSGLGGLACGHLLAQRGLRVVVLEQARTAGGCLQSYRRGGVEHDTGFHCLGGIEPGQSSYDTFKKLNLLHLPWHRMDALHERITLGGKTYCFAQGFDAFVDALAADFPAEREGLQELAALMRLTAERGADPKLFEQQTQQSALQYLHERISDPTLVDVLCTPASIKGEMNRETLPLFSFAHVNSTFIESSWRLRGPGRLIVDSLVSDIERMGGQVITGARVEHLDVSDGLVTTARTADGRTFDGRLFISDAHPQVTMQLIEARMGMFPRRIASLDNTGGMLTVQLVLKPGMVRYFNWNQYIVVGGRTLLLSCRVPQDDSPWATQVDLLTPVSNPRMTRDEQYRTEKAAQADWCIDTAAQFIPTLRDCIDKQVVSTPLTWHDYTLTPDGSAFGIRKDYRSPLTTFLSSRTPLKNLMLTGQSLMLHGIHGVTMTATMTLDESLKYLATLQPSH